MSKSAFEEMLRILEVHRDASEDDAPVPVDPTTVDVGELRPVTLQDVLAVEAIRATDDDDHMHKLVRIAHLVQLRSGLKTDQITAMPFDDYNLVVSRIVADVLPKIKAANAKVSAYNMFRAERGEGGAH